MYLKVAKINIDGSYRILVIYINNFLWEVGGVPLINLCLLIIFI